MAFVQERTPALPRRFDVATLAGLDNPYACYAELRAAGALVRAGPAQWLVPRHAEVSKLLRSGPSQGILSSWISVVETPTHGAAAEFTQQVMAARDGNDHSALRRKVFEAMRAVMPATLERLQSIVDEILDRAAEARRFEVMRDLALPLPTQVTCSLLGIPEENRAEAAAHALALARTAPVLPEDQQAIARFAPVLTPEQRAAADTAVDWLRVCVRQVAARRRKRPERDLITLLLASPQPEFSESVLVDNVIFVLFAGVETTMDVVGNGCAALIAHPDQFERLRRRPELLPTAVNELLRFDPPTQLTARVTSQPVEIDGRVVQRGRILLLMLGSANHDEQRFGEPERLDLGRHPNPHVAFGSGAHFCLGAELARMEVTHLFEGLASRFEALAHDGPPRRLASATLRSFSSLPVVGLGARERAVKPDAEARKVSWPHIVS
jgi:cytochrome P450